jgi:hypothetical protein
MTLKCCHFNIFAQKMTELFKLLKCDKASASKALAKRNQYCFYLEGWGTNEALEEDRDTSSN